MFYYIFDGYGNERHIQVPNISSSNTQPRWQGDTNFKNGLRNYSLKLGPKLWYEEKNENTSIFLKGGADRVDIF